MTTLATGQNSAIRKPIPVQWDWIIVLGVLCGVVGTAISSVHLAAFPHGEVILPWQFPPQSIVLVGLSGFFLGLYVYRNPHSYWMVLIATNLVTVGVYVLRFPIYDEYLTGCILVGAAMAVFRGRVDRRSRSETGIWTTVFVLLMLHWALMSVVGAVSYGNPKALRFTVIYGEVLASVLLLARYQFQLPGLRQLARLILWSVTWYFVAVVAHGYGATFFREQEHIMEGIGFGGTAYQAAAGIVACPVALIAIANKQWRLRFVASLVLLLSLAIAILADSRAAMLPLLAVTLAAPFVLGFTRTLNLAVGATGAVALMTWLIVGRTDWIVDMADALGRALEIDSGKMTYTYYGREVTAAKGDAGRFLYLEAGVVALVDNPSLWLTGAGSYGFFPVAGPYYEEIADDAGINTNVVNYGTAVGEIAEPPRPPAAGALFIESGFLGVTLFGALILNNVFRAAFLPNFYLRRKQFSAMGMVAAIPALLILPWGYFGEFQDMILLYLILAPYGIGDLLARGIARQSQSASGVAGSGTIVPSMGR